MHLQVLIRGLFVAAAITMAFAAAASATVVTTSTGGSAATPTIHAAGEGGHVVLDNPIANIECSSTLEWKVESHGESVTAKGNLSSLSFTGCTNNWTVTINAAGSLEAHWISGHNGTLTSNGTTLTAIRHTIFGTIECRYATSNTDIGTLTGGNPATFHIEAKIPVHGGSGLCGSGTASWTGKYVATTAAYIAAAGSSPTATSLTTSLSGGGKSGEAITVNEGSKVKDSATLSGTNASKATGNVEYKVYADSECKELVTSAGKVTVTGGSVPDSSEVELTAGAVYYWQAHYSGDSNNLESTSVCGKEVLTVKAVTSLTTSLSGEEQTGTEIEVQEEVGATDKATLKGTNVSKATGNVEYKVFADSECAEPVAEAGKVTVTGGSVPSSSEVELPGGLYFWQAVYSGDSTHLGSSGVCGSEIEVVREPTSLTTSLSGGGKSGPEIEIPEGTPVFDTATLSGANASEASGTVEYNVYADEECEELVAEAGAVEVSEGDVQVSAVAHLPAGTYYWQANYFGDSINQPSTSTCGLEILRVNTDSLTTSLSGESQSGVEIEVEEEVPVTDQATLNTETAGTATGTVEYNVYADDECEELVAEAGEVSVIGGVIPPSSEVLLPAGIYYWQAIYSGDLTHPPVTSACGIEVQTVAAATSLTTLLSAGEESGEEIEVEEGAGVSDSATLSGPNAAEATGSLEYNVYADEACEELVGHAGSVEVSGAAAPESEEALLPAGTYHWQATYFGDSLNKGSTSVCGTEVLQVEPAPLTTELSGDGEAGPEIEVPAETPVTDQATLNTETAGTATGTVEYNVYADDECEELVAEAGEVSVIGGVIPPSSEQTLPEGTYYWQAVYSGDESHAAATSICGNEVLQVKATWIVSVGDSYISGEGGRWAGNVRNNSEWEKIDALGEKAYESALNKEEKEEAIKGCHRSAAAEIFIQIPAVKSKNLACSGAETVSSSSGTVVFLSKLIKEGFFKPGLDFKDVGIKAEINAGKGRCGLPNCKGQALLLEEFAKQTKANNEGIKMVVVSIGGNDFEFGPLVKACAMEWVWIQIAKTGTECHKQKKFKDKFEAANLEAKQQLIEQGLKNVGSAMNNAGFGKNDYTILVQDYPSPIPELAAKFRYPDNLTRLDPGGCPVSDGDAEWANATALKKIDETVKKAYEKVSAEKNYNLKFMELETAFNGRRLCETGLKLVGENPYPTWKEVGAVDGNEWINQIRVLTPGTKFFIQESFHPGYGGQLALRNCVRQAYNNGNPKGGTCVIEAKGLFAPLGADLSKWQREPRMELKP
jgi:hypothetical protein